MSDFVVSALKYRPNSFESVVGQEAITSTLENAIASNQLAKAYLFCGPRGVGKTSCARIFAKKINEDLNNPEATENQDFSFNIFELDAASNNSVDDIRNITDQVRIPPQVGRYKVYIIDEVHMLSQQAFNAFLKTLEEPPPHAIFILATTEKHKIIPTILSRCQIYDFNRILIPDIVAHLEKIATTESIPVEKDALHVIAEKADGALRDALSIFDQVVSFTNKNITYNATIENLNVLDYNYYFKLVDFINAGDISQSLLLFNEILNKGFDGHHFISGLGVHFRNILVSKDTVTIQLLEVGDSVKQKYLEQAKNVPVSLIIKGLELVSKADVGYRASKNQRLLVEFTLIQICSLNPSEQKKNTVIEPEISKEIRREKITESKPELKPINSSVSKNNETYQEPIKEIPEAKDNTDTTISSTVESKREISQQFSSPSISESKEETNQEQKPKIVGFKSKLNLGGVSIKDSLKKKEEENNTIEKTDVNDFSQEKLIEYWNYYTKIVDDKNRKSLFTAMTKNKPVLKENWQIELQMDSKFLDDTFRAEQIEFTDYLKEKLNNYSLKIKTKVVINEKKEVFLYTDSEKFKAISKDNPDLIYFKDKFKLDFEM